uniref:Variant surface glycoprotein 1125.1756 n=1 Tax=Trypanosoma brucei TaxID=5691 RepID=A0A1J0R7N1_9TRYP|nr:variant surface glycoprotein 1125.1756 [Trypanosoma brucei]
MQKQVNVCIGTHDHEALMWHLTILLLTLSQLATVNPTRTAAMAVTTLCDEAAYIAQLRSGLADQLITSKSRLRNLQSEAEEMELAAAAATNKKTKRAYYVLEALERARAAKQLQDINAAEPIIVRSANKLGIRQAQLHLLYTIYPRSELKITAKPKTTETSGIFGTTSQTCVITTSADEADFNECLKAAEHQKAIQNAYDELSQERHIKATPGAMFKRRSIKITAAAKGTISNAMATVDKGQFQDGSKALESTTHGIGAKIEFADEADVKLTALKLTQTPSSTDGCTDDDPDKDKAKVTQGGLAYAICKVRTLKITLQETVKTTTKATLATDPDAPTILAALSRGPEGPSSKPLTNNEIKQLLTDTFGPSDNVISESFINPLANKALKLRLNGVDSGAKLSDYLNKAIIGAALTASRKSEEEDQSCKNRETEQSVAAGSTAKCKEDTGESECKKGHRLRTQRRKMQT